MMNLLQAKRSYLRGAVILGIFLCPMIVFAVDIQQAKIKENVILQVQWGNGKGEIGEVPNRLGAGTPGESINPIAVDSKGNIYIGDSVNYRVLKFNGKGEYLSEINLNKYDVWAYKNIPDLIVDSGDNLYENNRLVNW